MAIPFSPDGWLLVSLFRDNVIIFWLAPCEELSQLLLWKLRQRIGGGRGYYTRILPRPKVLDVKTSVSLLGLALMPGRF